MPQIGSGKLVKEEAGKTLCQPLSHALRVRILEVANERAISPIQFVNEELQPKGVVFKNPQHAMSHVSYHFRELEKAGCLYVVEEIGRRGAIEHVYVGKVTLSSDEFEQLSKEERSDLSRVGLQGFIARADSSLWTDTFDKRKDRHLTWMPLFLDEQAWTEVTEALDTCFGTVQRIQAEAADRLDEDEEVPVPATVALFGFESPPPSKPRASRDD